MTNRRSIIGMLPIALLALPACERALAADPVKLSEDDPQAVALGYTADPSKPGKGDRKKYVAGQSCANCQLYKGQAGDIGGPCAIFAGKLVAAKGWCTVYSARA